MLALIEITLDFFLFSGIALAAIGIGLIVGSIKLKSAKKQVGKLEKEMLNSHAEILRLQKELSDNNLNQPQAPVFSIRNSPEHAKEKLPDSVSNKKAFPGRGKPTL